MSVNSEVVDDGGEEATSGEIEERIEDFKQDKARQKSSFTRIKNKLLRMLDEQDYPSRREIKEMCHQLSDAQERAMETMHRLSMENALLKDRKKEKSRRRDGQIGTRIFGGERESTRVFRCP